MCLKIHSRHLYAPLCSIFGPNSLNVAHYAALIWAKSPTKWSAQLPESNFQTHSSMKTGNNFADVKKRRHIKNEVTEFLDTHRDINFSAAKFVYLIYSEQERSEKIIDFINGHFVQTEKDLEMEKIISSTVSPDGLLRLMRKSLSGKNASLLREKIVDHEQELLPLIKEKCIRNKQDVFIENALHFFMMSNTDCCDWIMEAYSQFQSEYLKSMFCLVLGMRGDESMIPFLMNEARRMKKEYPDEFYDQGPALAVQELASWYLD